MKTLHFLASIALLSGVSHGSQAAYIDMTSGTTGTTYLNQSFDETRGVTATVLGTVDLALHSMHLDAFNIGLSPGGTVGARVYANDTGALIASADASVPVGFDQSITIPIAATLTAGSSYRFGFFIKNGINGGSGDIFDPDPANALGFSFIESAGLFNLTSAWSIASDAFPTNPNTSIPLMSLEVSAVPEPTIFWLLASALMPLAMTVTRRRAADQEPIFHSTRRPK